MHARIVVDHRESDREGASQDVGAGRRVRPDGAHGGNPPLVGGGRGESSLWVARRDHLLLRLGGFASPM